MARFVLIRKVNVADARSLILYTTRGRGEVVACDTFNNTGTRWICIEINFVRHSATPCPHAHSLVCFSGGYYSLSDLSPLCAAVVDGFLKCVSMARCCSVAIIARSTPDARLDGTVLLSGYHCSIDDRYAARWRGVV